MSLSILSTCDCANYLPCLAINEDSMEFLLKSTRCHQLMPSNPSSWFRCSVTSTLAMTLILLTELIWHCDTSYRSPCCYPADESLYLLGLLLIRVFVLWDRNKTIFRLIIIGAAAAYTTSIAFLIAFVKDLASESAGLLRLPPHSR